MDHLQDERGSILVRVGDQVENDDARFFVGGINDSQTLCHLDKTKPFELLNESSPMAACIKQGNYSASVRTLKTLNTELLDETKCGHCHGSGRMVRDPDIGTDQECFVCDGSGVVHNAELNGAAQQRPL